MSATRNSPKSGGRKSPKLNPLQHATAQTHAMFHSRHLRPSRRHGRGNSGYTFRPNQFAGDDASLSLLAQTLVATPTTPAAPAVPAGLATITEPVEITSENDAGDSSINRSDPATMVDDSASTLAASPASVADSAAATTAATSTAATDTSSTLETAPELPPMPTSSPSSAVPDPTVADPPRPSTPPLPPLPPAPRLPFVVTGNQGVVNQVLTMGDNGQALWRDLADVLQAAHISLPFSDNTGTIPQFHFDDENNEIAAAGNGTASAVDAPASTAPTDAAATRDGADSLAPAAGVSAPSTTISRRIMYLFADAANSRFTSVGFPASDAVVLASAKVPTFFINNEGSFVRLRSEQHYVPVAHVEAKKVQSTCMLRSGIKSSPKSGLVRFAWHPELTCRVRLPALTRDTSKQSLLVAGFANQDVSGCSSLAHLSASKSQWHWQIDEQPTNWACTPSMPGKKTDTPIMALICGDVVSNSWFCVSSAEGKIEVSRVPHDISTCHAERAVELVVKCDKDQITFSIDGTAVATHKVHLPAASDELMMVAQTLVPFGETPAAIDINRVSLAHV